MKDGEWVWPKMHGYKMQCCDCGLIHEFDFVVVDKESGEPLNGSFAVIFRAYRVNKEKRKHKKTPTSTKEK